jgi:hypothetical protein
MALTSGAKKFIGLLCFTGIIAGGLYYNHIRPKSEIHNHQASANTEIKSDEISKTVNVQTDEIPVTTKNTSEGSNDQTHNHSDDDVSNNRGLQNVINSGKSVK